MKSIVSKTHDDVIKWKHFPRYLPFMLGIHRSPVNSPNKGQWRGALMLSLFRAWIDGWVNNCQAGDWKRHPANFDVIIMNSSATENACCCANPVDISWVNPYEQKGAYLGDVEYIALSVQSRDAHNMHIPDMWDNWPCNVMSWTSKAFSHLIYTDLNGIAWCVNTCTLTTIWFSSNVSIVWGSLGWMEQINRYLYHHLPNSDLFWVVWNLHIHMYRYKYSTPEEICTASFFYCCSLTIVDVVWASPVGAAPTTSPFST